MLAKDKLSTIEVLIFKDLIDSYISHVSLNNVFKEYDVMNKAIKNSNTFDSENKYAWYDKNILIPEKEFTNTNYERLKKALVFIEKKFINPDGNIS